MPSLGNIAALIGAKQIIRKQSRKAVPRTTRTKTPTFRADPIFPGDPRFTRGPRPTGKTPASSIPVHAFSRPTVGRKIPTMGLTPRKDQPLPRGIFGSAIQGGTARSLGLARMREQRSAFTASISRLIRSRKQPVGAP